MMRGERTETYIEKRGRKSTLRTKALF